MSMAERRVFLDARQVLTMAGTVAARGGDAMARLEILDNASVVVEDGRIAWVGASADLDPAARKNATIVDCSGKTLMPALVDPHTHLVWGGDRRDELEMRLAGADYEEIFAAGGGILSSVRQTRAADEETLFKAAFARMERMRATGTTTFEIKSGYGLNLETELKQLRVARRLRDEAGLRVKTSCLVAHAVPAEHRGSEGGRTDFVARICDEILPAVAKEGLADYCDVFCDRGAFTPEESRKVLERAAWLGMKLRVHANEFGQTGGARLAAELRAVSADHLLHLDDEERSLLRDSGVVATLLPGTSLVLGKPFADGRSLVDAGVPVAVATDCNPGSCALESLSLVLGLACYGNRLSPAEAVCATTHNAAASLDLASEVGRIEAGLSADLLVLATSDYRDLVYHAGSPLIDAVFQRGEQVHPQPGADR
jgi:imidazolonepropionase